MPITIVNKLERLLIGHVSVANADKIVHIGQGTHHIESCSRRQVVHLSRSSRCDIGGTRCTNAKLLWLQIK